MADEDDNDLAKQFSSKSEDTGIQWKVAFEWLRPFLPYMAVLGGFVISGLLGFGDWIAHRILNRDQPKLSPEAQLNIQIPAVNWEYGQVSQADVFALKERMREFRKELQADRLFFDLVNPDATEAIVIAQVAAPDVSPLAGFFQQATLEAGELFKVKTSLVTDRGHILFRELSAFTGFEKLILVKAPEFQILTPEFLDSEVRKIYPHDNWRRLNIINSDRTVFDYSYVGPDPSMYAAMRNESTRLNVYVPVFRERKLTAIFVANLVDSSQTSDEEIPKLLQLRERMGIMGRELAEIID